MNNEIYKTVWYLNNYCNFNCEYCLDTFGRTDPKNNKLIPIPFVKNTCKNLLSIGKKKYSFTLFGGETTLYKDLPTFIDTLYKNMDNKIVNMMFTSNASRNINYFKNFLHYDDTFIIRLSAHMEHYDNLHFLNIVDFLCENNIRVFVEVMYNLKYKDLVFKVADEIIKRKLKYPKLNGRIKPVFNNVPFENYFYNYLEQDLNDFYKKNDEFGYKTYKYNIDQKEIGKYCILGSNKCVLDPFGIYFNFCVIKNKPINYNKSIYLSDSLTFKKNFLKVVKCQTDKKCLHAPIKRFNNKEEAQRELEKILYENN